MVIIYRNKFNVVITSYLIFMTYGNLHIECPSYVKHKVLPDREHSMLPLEIQISSCCVMIVQIIFNTEIQYVYLCVCMHVGVQVSVCARARVGVRACVGVRVCVLAEQILTIILLTVTSTVLNIKC
jgi:hypothetical protein